MEKWQYAWRHILILLRCWQGQFVFTEFYAQLLAVDCDIVMTEHNTFWQAGRA